MGVKTKEMKALSIEQMTKLKELGVDTSKASMCYVFFESDGNKYEKLVVNDEDCYEFASLNPIPTFTLHDIIELLPKAINSHFGILTLAIKSSGDFLLHVVSYENRCKLSNVVWFFNDNILDAAYQMLIWVIENGYLKTK